MYHLFPGLVFFKWHVYIIHLWTWIQNFHQYSLSDLIQLQLFNKLPSFSLVKAFNLGVCLLALRTEPHWTYRLWWSHRCAQLPRAGLRRRTAGSTLPTAEAETWAGAAASGIELLSLFCSHWKEYQRNTHPHLEVIDVYAAILREKNKFQRKWIWTLSWAKTVFVCAQKKRDTQQLLLAFEIWKGLWFKIFTKFLLLFLQHKFVVFRKRTRTGSHVWGWREFSLTKRRSRVAVSQTSVHVAASRPSSSLPKEMAHVPSA